MILQRTWKRYILYIIGVQLLVFCALCFNNHYSTNKVKLREKLSDSSFYIRRTKFYAGKDIIISELNSEE